MEIVEKINLIKRGCDICGKESLHTCQDCGRDLCKEHYISVSRFSLPNHLKPSLGLRCDCEYCKICVDVRKSFEEEYNKLVNEKEELRKLKFDLKNQFDKIINDLDDFSSNLTEEFEKKVRRIQEEMWGDR